MADSVTSSASGVLSLCVPSLRLVHDVLQVLCALDETCFVGDGGSLELARSPTVKPTDLEERVRAALYPPSSDGVFEQQRRVLAALIDGIERLAAG